MNFAFLLGRERRYVHTTPRANIVSCAHSREKRPGGEEEEEEARREFIVAELLLSRSSFLVRPIISRTRCNYEIKYVPDDDSGKDAAAI